MEKSFEEMRGLFDSTSMLSILVAIVAIYIVWYIIDLVRYRKMPPGPLLGWPLLGNAPMLHGAPLHVRFMQLSELYGPVYSLKLGSWRAVVATGPEALTEIMIGKSTEFAGRAMFPTVEILSSNGKGVGLVPYGPAWKFHRKLFNTALRALMSNQSALEGLILKQVKALSNTFRDTKALPFDPRDEITETVANILAKEIFGADFDSENSDFKEIIHCLMTVAHDKELQESVVDVLPILKYFPNSTLRRIKTYVERADWLVGNFVDDHVERFDPINIKDFVDGLLAAREEAINMDDSQIKEFLSLDHIKITARDMLVASFETTTTTIRWAILFLVNHPQFQEDLHKELSKVLSLGELPSFQHKNQLPFLQACILETLRLGNVIVFPLPHTTTRDTTLQGYDIPKDTLIFPHLGSVHLDPNCWEKPKDFNPYRHFDSDGRFNPNPRNFFPFYAGRRSCSGENMAKLELFLFLGGIFSQFILSCKPGEDQLDDEGILGITLSPKPFQICATPRY